MGGQTVGWIGFGSMGSRMAKRLFDRGITVVGYNRDREKLSSCPGAVPASSPAEVAAKTRLVFLIVTDGKASSALIKGKDGVLEGISPGSTVVNLSTIAPEDAREEARLFEAREVAYLDVPVSGSVVPAEKGELLLLAGGDPGTLRKIEPLLDILGRKTLFFGPAGSGMKAKLVINALLASHMEAFAQVLLLGEELGLERGAVLDMILESPLATPFYRIKKSNLEKRSYEKAFSLALMTKDLGLLARELLSSGSPSQMAWSLYNDYREAQRMGLGEQDLSSVYEYLRKRSSIP
jgi:3-hydroxyisobutyrate dehydrogenase